MGVERRDKGSDFFILSSVYVRTTKLCPYNCAEDFRNVKKNDNIHYFAPNVYITTLPTLPIEFFAIISNNSGY